MVPDFGQRKIQTIMMGDIVGYSRLMESDEEDTHTRVKKLEREFISPIVRSHSGAIVKYTGDGFLAIFDEPRIAVRCAIQLQSDLVERASSFPPERRIVYRLALNSSEIILEADDVYGDGVNITARLQSFAEPGDIIAPAELVDAVSGEIASYPMTDLGELRLKNVRRTVRAVGIRVGSTRNLLASIPLDAGDALPSIAVLPFRQPGYEKSDAYTADAIMEEVTHGLSATAGLIVISSGSTRRYASGATDARKIGRQLNVRYVLGGSVQRAGDKLRVNTVLTEADTGLVVRHDRFDGRLQNLFDLEEQIALSTMKSVAPNIMEREVRRSMRKPPESLSAYELVLRALEFLYRLQPEAQARARGLLQQALGIDPNYAPAYAYIAYWYIFRVGEGWSPDPVADAREAARMARLALDRDPRDGLALAINGHVQSFLLRDYESANAILDQAVVMAPNCALAWTMSSITRGYLSDGAAAVERAEHGLRLSPLDGHVFWFEGQLAQAHYVNGDYDRAVAWARRAAVQNPAAMFNLRTLAASLVALGRTEAAHRVAKTILEYNPEFRLTSYLRSCPFTGQVLVDWLSRLREAGLPEC